MRLTYEQDKANRHRRGTRIMIVGGVIALVSWLAMPPRIRKPIPSVNNATGQIETQKTDFEGRLNWQIGIAFGSLLILVGNLHHIDRD